MVSSTLYFFLVGAVPQKVFAS